MSALEGPLNIIAGVIVGVLGGTICGFTRLFHSKIKRVAICVIMGFFIMYLSLKVHFHGAGALAGLMTTITVSYIWQNDALSEISIFKKMGVTKGGASHEWHHQTEHTMAALWDSIASPLLFAVIGSSIDLKVLDMKIIPNALLVVGVGMCVRVPVAFLATGGKNLSYMERFFVGLAWIPKATVQAALGSVPLDLILKNYAPDHPEFEQWNAWGQQILVTAVVAIIFTAPIGLICINVFGDKVRACVSSPSPILSLSRPLPRTNLFFLHSHSHSHSHPHSHPHSHSHSVAQRRHPQPPPYRRGTSGHRCKACGQFQRWWRIGNCRY